MRRSGFVLAVFLLAGAVHAGDDQVLVEAMGTRQPSDAAIARGLAWLQARQGAEGFVGGRHQVAVTGLTVVAHLATGITPADADQGPRLRRALAALLLAQRDGYFGALDGGRMYSHGIATLALAHSLGMTDDPGLDLRLRQALELAVGVTVAAAQRPKGEAQRGGWRYTPDDSGADMSLTGWQLLSLHAAGQVGITVPPAVIDDAVDFVRRMTAGDGRVGYEHPGDHPALRGIAVLGLGVATHPDEERLRAVEARIIAEPLTWQGPWFFYRAYYDALALARMSGPAAVAAAERLEALLRDHQNQDGGWPAPPGDNEAGNGEAYCAAMAILALSVGKRLLPAYR